MSNKKDRETKEIKNLLDPKYARNFWRTVGNAIANRPAVKPISTLDKEGNPTKESEIETSVYLRLSKDLKTLGDPNCTEPTELEMIIASQMVMARTNPSSAAFIRDTLGAKPVDESKVDASINEFDSLTDEELELLAKHREQRKEGEDNEKE